MQIFQSYCHEVNGNFGPGFIDSVAGHVPNTSNLLLLNLTNTVAGEEEG